MITPTPALVETILLMREMAATDEEWDLLASIEHANDVHQSSAPDSDRGTCVCCETPWPCRMWNDTFVLAVEWTSRKGGEACDRAKQTLLDLPEPIAPVPVAISRPIPPKQRTRNHLKVIK